MIDRRTHIRVFEVKQKFSSNIIDIVSNNVPVYPDVEFVKTDDDFVILVGYGFKKRYKCEPVKSTAIVYLSPVTVLKSALPGDHKEVMSYNFYIDNPRIGEEICIGFGVGDRHIVWRSGERLLCEMTSEDEKFSRGAKISSRYYIYK